MYEALVTIRVKTTAPHDNPAYQAALYEAIRSGDYDIESIAKPFKGEPPCEQHGEPK